MELPPAEKFVLLGLVDYADENGGSCFPSIRGLSRKTGYSERKVQRIIHELRRKLFIESKYNKGGRGLASQYAITLDRGIELQRNQKRVTGGTPFQGKKRVSDDAEKGDSLVPKRVTAQTPQSFKKSETLLMNHQAPPEDRSKKSDSSQERQQLLLEQERILNSGLYSSEELRMLRSKSVQVLKAIHQWKSLDPKSRVVQ